MMVEFLNKIRIHAMVSAIMYLAAGVLLLVWPETASSVIAMIVCAKKFDRRDVRGNWIEQGINAVAQACAMIGVLLL